MATKSRQTPKVEGRAEGRPTTKAKKPRQTLAPEHTPTAEGQWMTPGLLLDLFDEPIMFRRMYVDLTGSVTCALWLSHVVGYQETLRYVDEERLWFELSTEEMTRITGLSRWEQETARRRLRDLSILRERRVGMPARRQLAIDWDQLGRLVREQSDVRWKHVNDRYRKRSAGADR